MISSPLTSDLRDKVYLILCLEMSNLVWDGNAAEIRNHEFKTFPSPGYAVIYLILNHLITSHGREVSAASLVWYRFLYEMLK